METAATSQSFSRFEQLRYGRDILRQEGEALMGLAERLSDEFCTALELLFACHGNVIVTGMGKAGLVGQKIAATLASTGTRSHFLHPAEAFHGDLGRVGSDDVILALSFSGETEEIVRILPYLRSAESPIVAITGRDSSTLAKSATITLSLGTLHEACSLGLAPSTSTTAMLGLGDAIALVLSRMRKFDRDDFARFHPGGSLGRKLAFVDDVMRPLAECRLAGQNQTLREVLVHVGRPGRRTGAIMLTDNQGRLSGVFTDSDLARLLEINDENSLGTQVCDVMTRSPRAVAAGSRLSEAMVMLAQFKISELPVVDGAGKPQGLVDITDVVGLLPADTVRSEPAPADSNLAPPPARATIPLHISGLKTDR